MTASTGATCCEAAATLQRVRRALDEADFGGPERHEVVEEIRAAFTTSASPPPGAGLHPDVCVRCARATLLVTSEDGEYSEWLVSWATPMDCDHITKDGRR